MVDKILIVEDDPDIRFIIHMALREAGYNVEQMASGAPLLEKNTAWPDLLILDKALPNVDGITLCKQLRLKEETRTIPIVMISCYHNLKKKAKEAGVNDFIEKPFHLRELLKVIEKNIKQSHAHQ